MRLALCTWLYALGSMHLALCTRLCALGSMHLALCTWLYARLYAFGCMHLAPCTRLYALGSVRSAIWTWLYLRLTLFAWLYLHLALCTWLHARLYALGSMHLALCIIDSAQVILCKLVREVHAFGNKMTKCSSEHLFRLQTKKNMFIRASSRTFFRFLSFEHYRVVLPFEAMFSYIILGEDFMGPEFASHVSDARRWRTSIAHDHKRRG